MEKKLNIPDFESHLEDGILWSKDNLATMQVNITKTCNLACKHCHVESSPSRTEDITRETADKVIELFKKEGFQILDITGGAPEMSKQYKYLIESLAPYAKKIMTRTNLTIHLEPEYEGYLEFMKDHKVEIVASLPFYEKDKTDRQRGMGVYDESIEVLQKLTKMGYGVEDDLILDLVYNPNGAILPGDQVELENIYRAKLDEYGIKFNQLFTITNNPSGRFYNWLERSGNLDRYMDKLLAAFNPATIDDVMCRDMISVNDDGTIYDCDFNLAIKLGMVDEPKTLDQALEMGLGKRKIATANHCYGCTAGSGSSCGGALE
ncbi:arsenosugar biosynthesis radical SAM (seleno)protein ArsS [uncultured Ezakiella sp.]|uniref:arsenosugar biosynthesis radical SAM (seleno)protein ArsS n=1 Tax=uncultured Ezakiella sp. TaxID=1637529 RepID=UPI0025D266DD|nr:arsenosugar biosynthesis radical SAM (seleno)protein ArsS [uncultured Ezakiella sp.]